MTPGPLELVLIIVLVVLLFGAGRVPSIMENLAKGINSFKKGLRDEDESVKRLRDGDKKDDSHKDSGNA